MDLNKLVNEAMAEISATDFVPNLIRSKIEGTLKEIVGDILGAYSAFGKTLKSSIADQLNINMEALGISGYNVLIANLLKEELDKAMHIQGIEKIKESVEEILKFEKTEVKLSDLFKEMKREYKEYADSPTRASFHYDASSLAFIHFDPKDGKGKYDCQYYLTMHKDGRIHSLEFDRRPITTEAVMRGFYGLKKKLFQLFATGSTIVLDYDDIDTWYGDDEDEDED